VIDGLDSTEAIRALARAATLEEWFSLSFEELLEEVRVRLGARRMVDALCCFGSLSLDGDG
jgi:hypothetical protein